MIIAPFGFCLHQSLHRIPPPHSAFTSIHSLTLHSLTQSITHSLNHSLTHSLTHSRYSLALLLGNYRCHVAFGATCGKCRHSITHFITHCITHCITRSLHHSLHHSLTAPLTHSLTHAGIQSRLRHASATRHSTRQQIEVPYE
jgi:hypothetical protein